MWGPGYALRGEDATYVDNAVYILDTMKHSMEKFFLFGLICYFTSSILVVWLLFDQSGSVTVSGIFFLILIWLYCKGLRIMKALTPTKKVTGRVNFNRVNNLGHLMGDAAGTLQGDSVNANFASKI